MDLTGEGYPMRLVAFSAALMALSACGGDDDDDNGFVAPNGAKCATRAGAYTFKFAEKSGDCGPLPDIIFVAGQPSDDPDCTGGPVDNDQCVVSLTNTCKSASGVETSFAGQVQWSADGNSGTGAWQVIISDAADNLLCQSIYDITVTR